MNRIEYQGVSQSKLIPNGWWRRKIMGTFPGYSLILDRERGEERPQSRRNDTISLELVDGVPTITRAGLTITEYVALNHTNGRKPVQLTSVALGRHTLTPRG